MMRKVIKYILITVVAIVVVLNLPIVQVNHQQSSSDYSNWMKEALNDEQRIVDVKMLGAHDAFSQGITMTSKADLYAGGMMKGVTGFLLKGFLVRQSVTQIAEADALLESGVRYFDVRLTYDEGAFYTKHNFVATDFKDVAPILVDYLELHEGEFIVLDFQHIDGLDYSNGDDYSEFTTMLRELGLLDNSYYPEDSTLGSVTYSDVTSSGTKSQAIIIDKFTETNVRETYFYDDAIRSNWANDDDFATVLDFLSDESDYIETSGAYDDSFRIMQAVTTMQTDGPGFKDSIVTWSLIERASSFNPYLISDDNFAQIFENLPIVMVDYTNSNDDEFLDDIMELIINQNIN